MIWLKFSDQKGSAIYPRGQDTVEALQDWSKSEVTKSVDRGYDLGKFLFSVNAATIGTVVAIARASDYKSEAGFWVALGILTASAIVAIQMAIPNQWKLGGETNLAQVHKDIVDSTQIVTLLWLVLWFLGAGISVYKLLF